MDGLVDIHCHLLPGIDDGAKDLDASLEMARLSVAEGVDTVVVTPHQCGAFEVNRGDDIRRRTADLQAELDRVGVPLKVLPGADVRIDDNLISGLESGDIVSLGDHRRHVLLELPHELYLPLEPVLDALERIGVVGVLSHPERNAGILSKPELLRPLVERGCLMQVTAGSFVGGFGDESQRLAERMARDGLIHFVSTDGHGPRRRRPRLGNAMRAVAKLVGDDAALRWCSHQPRAVAEGRDVEPGVAPVKPPRRGWSLFGRGAA